MISRFSFSVIVALLCNLFAGASASTIRPPWLDSAINYTAKKILAFEDLNDRKFVTNIINIDLAVWTGQINDHEYYYEKSPAPAELVFSPNDYNQIFDSVSKLNLGWKANGAAPYCLYVLYLKNFPVKLDKDVDTSLINGEGSVKDKLNKLGALNDANLKISQSRVIEIIDAIYNKIHAVNSAPNRILYTIATLYGQHAPGKRLIPLSFLSDIKTGGPDIDNSPYKQDLEYFPKGYYQRSKYGKVEVLPTLKNSVFALVSQINCQFNGKCYLNLNSLQHQASRDIYKEYTGKGIDELLLRRIVLEIDKLDKRSLFDLLHYFRNKHAVELHNDLFPIPYPHTPTTGEMQTLFSFVNKFNHLQNKLKGVISERDTLLMAGYFNRFNTELIKSISLPVRIAHLEKLCAGKCLDFNSVSQIADYEHACEEFALSLLKNIPANEERLLLDKLRTSGLLWKLSYSLDNSTFSFVGKNNYTIFINLISNYWKKGYHDHFAAGSGSGKDPVIVFWKETFFSDNSWFQNDIPNNRIKFFQWNENTSSYSSDPFRTIDVYEPVMIYLTEPSTVLGLDKGTSLVVPAIFLDFLQWRKGLQDLTTATAVAIDIAALATGIGELYQAASITTRVIASIEIAVSSMDLAIQNQQVENAIVSCFDVEQEGRDFIAIYRNVSAIINCGIAAKGLIANFAEKCKQYDDLYKKGEQELSGAFKTAHPDEADKIEALEKEIKEEIDAVQPAPPADISSTNWKSRGFDNIDDWTNNLSAIDKTNVEQIIGVWDDAVLVSLNEKLNLFPGLKLEFPQNTQLLKYFNSLETTWWAKYGLGGLCKRSSSNIPATFKQMIGEIEITSLGQKLKLKTISLDETSASYIGKLFDEMVESKVRTAWQQSNFSNFPPTVSSNLQSLKNTGYELVIEGKISINGSNPVPDYLFIKKIQTPNGITYDLNNVKYVDCKYLWDSPFTSSQSNITSSVNLNGFASVTVNSINGLQNLNGQLILSNGVQFKITTVEKLTIDQFINLVIQ